MSVCKSSFTNSCVLFALLLALLPAFFPAESAASPSPSAENVLTPTNALDPDSPPSIRDNHTALPALGMGSAAALLVLTIALIVVNRCQQSALARLRQTEESLRESEERHRRLF